MSVTHPDAGFMLAPRRGFAVAHPQFTPFLVAVAIFAASVAMALTFTGLPA